jgi:hypothetical protein
MQKMFRKRAVSLWKYFKYPDVTKALHAESRSARRNQSRIKAEKKVQEYFLFPHFQGQLIS